MKNYLPILVLFLSLSCRKDPVVYDGFTAGSKENVTWITHDSVAQAKTTTWSVVQDNMYLDLDADGINDLLFTSHISLLTRPFDIEEPYVYRVDVKVVNDIFSLAHKSEGTETYEHYSEPVYDYDGTWPRKTTTVTNSCDSLPGSKVVWSAPTVNYLVRHYPIDEDLLWVNYISPIMINRSKFQTLSYEGNEGPGGGDSLIGFHQIYDKYCQSMPLNMIYYIPFKKNIGTKYKYGWIQLDITDNNRIAIFESAIQNEYN